MKKKIKKILCIVLVVILAVILIPVLVFFCARFVNGFNNKINTKNGVQESTYIDVNGIKQYIQIRGEDVDNPVMIFIHGGPAQPMTFYSTSYQQELESKLTIINYDQRGCGRTYYANNNDTNTNMDLFLGDLDGIVEYAKERFGKDKVIIVGHSWGTVIGTMYIQKHPENVSCYIGMGQVTNLIENKLNVARTALEKDEIKGTENETLLLDVMERVEKVEKYEDIDFIDITMLSMASAPYIATEEGPGIGTWDMITSADMNLNDVKWFLKSMDTLSFFEENKAVMEYALLGFDIDELPYTYKVPVYYIVGEGDYVVCQNDVKAYYEKINAPDKEIYQFENVGHNIMITNPKLFCDTIKSIVERSSNQ